MNAGISLGTGDRDRDRSIGDLVDGVEVMDYNGKTKY